MKRTIRLLVIISIVLSTTLISFTATSIKTHDNIPERILIDISLQYDMVYESMIDTLMWHEGYRAYPYRCLANVKTVGYGHAIKKGESFTYPITRERAEVLLRSDFDKAVEATQRLTDLEGPQLLAIAHFVHALGSGNFYRSTLRKLIEQDKSIDKEIVKWIHIKTKSGKIIRSDHLLRSRQMELNLYNNLSI